MDLFDFNRDGEVDGMELMLGMEMLGGDETTKQTYGYTDEEEELEDELFMAGLDPLELEMMDEEERREALEEAGLDPDDFEELF